MVDDCFQLVSASSSCPRSHPHGGAQLAAMFEGLTVAAPGCTEPLVEGMYSVSWQLLLVCVWHTAQSHDPVT